jgi:hypothetical protein
MIGRVHASARKHVSAAHERRPFAAAHHEHFRTVRGIAQYDDCRSRTGIDDELGRHVAQY